jgi:hypothetical protein
MIVSLQTARELWLYNGIIANGYTLEDGKIQVKS